MRWSRWIRQFHRWTSVVFTLCVLANLLAMGRVSEETGILIGTITLLPLFLLLLTGLYLFALPYATRWRRRGAAS